MSKTTWKFYLRPAETWKAMLADIGRAKTSIDLEQYILSADGIGKHFFEFLKKKREKGVVVRLLCDGVGSFNLLNSAAAKELVARGVEVKFFNPISPWRIHSFSSWFLRDHRKLLIVDGKIAYTGGVGLEKRMESWRDTNVRMTGPVVSEMSSVFEQMWLAAPKHKFFRFKPLFFRETPFSFLTNSPRFRGRYIYHDLLKNIRAAKRYIYITTPYFVPSIRIFSALTKAAKRGVDVRLLLPESSDVRTADIAAGSYFVLALNAGVKIYLYDNVRILHTKTAVSDDAWGTVGSANMDNLSLLLNFEGNVSSSDKDFVSELKSQFMKDIAAIRPLTKESWVGRSILRKLLEVVTWPIHGVL